ncbi:ribonuclease P protein subunit p29 isoform X2 [Eurytemora carolleeae]|uniref:ribonuclease P protein subunit p29 isoform X2 n=1 Tax=Eurytemora carolleeae TaxID=1294199 RepID=UPI000C766E36|nr:ribonuclease P protein subunit p29 isoform X2 [Eurytemora carolleeae]|eukprot:XP_023326524.1 ribonuclease P protein subunit p29-like isoform X2 [Eurytemora affinis]
MNSKPKPILAPLPDTFYSNLPGLEHEAKDATEFFETRVKESDRREIPDEFKKTIVLEAQKLRRAQTRKPRISKKMLTSKEKRDLGLNRLPKVGLNYQQFQALNDLWRTYIIELLELDSLKKSGWEPGNLEEPRLQQIQMKICRADLHGAIIEVSKSDCGSQEGRKGICLLETKHTLQIISTDNKLRMIPKKGTTFSFEISGFRFSFPGSSFLSRPAERATKKPKNKMPLDF